MHPAFPRVQPVLWVVIVQELQLRLSQSVRLEATALPLGRPRQLRAALGRIAHQWD